MFDAHELAGHPAEQQRASESTVVSTPPMLEAEKWE